LQAFLKNNPPPPPAEVPEPEIIVNQMPEDVEIAVEPMVSAHEVDTNTIAVTQPPTGVFVPKY